ncbi:MAG: hypothetical protein E6Q85_04150 [Thiothrix sp.]|nr:MAG: hypothetical protein E6Q85_04150 [Thiothrix sp.]
MPIPLILAGIAIAAGTYGAVKGIEALDDFDEANSVNEQAKDIYDTASSNLEKARDAAQESLEDLGELKFALYERRLIPFVAAFKKIHKIDFQHDAIDAELQLDVSEADMLSIEDVSLKMSEVVGGGITALGAGGLAGLAAYGSVGLIASASTGTAIASLSGAAATNATLAWLGGGALSAGGFGMAGGAYVLGGIVAGPVLAVGGMLLASKAEEAKHNAYSNLSEAKIAAEQMQAAQIATAGVHSHIKEIMNVLYELDETFEPLLEGLQSLVMNSPKNWSGKLDYTKLSKEDQVGVMASMMMAKTVKNILETPILTERGIVNRASRQAVNESHASLERIQESLACLA